MTSLSRIHETRSDQDFDQLQTPVTPLVSAQHHEGVDDGEAPKTSNVAFLLMLGVITLLAYGIMDLLLYVEANLDQHPIMTSIIVLLTFAFFLILGLTLRQELRCYQGLRAIASQQTVVLDALATHNTATLIQLIQARTPTHSKGLAAQLHKRFWHTVQTHHSSDDIWQLYQQMVLTPLQEKAEAQITQATVQGSAISLLSPNDLIHTSVLLWRSMKLVKDLALIYGIRPGIYGNVQLLKLSLQHALIQQGSDLLLEASLKQLSEHLLAKIAEKGAQAATTGFLLRRLGMATVDMLSIH